MYFSQSTQSYWTVAKISLHTQFPMCDSREFAAWESRKKVRWNRKGKVKRSELQPQHIRSDSISKDCNFWGVLRVLSSIARESVCVCASVLARRTRSLLLRSTMYFWWINKLNLCFWFAFEDIRGLKLVMALNVQLNWQPFYDLQRKENRITFRAQFHS